MPFSIMHTVSQVLSPGLYMYILARISRDPPSYENFAVYYIYTISMQYGNTMNCLNMNSSLIICRILGDHLHALTQNTVKSSTLCIEFYLHSTVQHLRACSARMKYSCQNFTSSEQRRR